jgi:hypothetical protein
LYITTVDWHNVACHNAKYLEASVDLIEEDNDWKNIVAEFEAAPAQGIRGSAGLRRRNVYINQDNNLQAIQQQINNMDPLTY